MRAYMKERQMKLADKRQFSDSDGQTKKACILTQRCGHFFFVASVEGSTQQTFVKCAEVGAFWQALWHIFAHVCFLTLHLGINYTLIPTRIFVHMGVLKESTHRPEEGGRASFWTGLVYS